MNLQMNPLIGSIELSRRKCVLCCVCGAANLDAACTYDGDAVLTPIAYRTHAHTWCEVISGYRVRGQQWNELGRHSPQLPQVCTGSVLCSVCLWPLASGSACVSLCRPGSQADGPPLSN